MDELRYNERYLALWGVDHGTEATDTSYEAHIVCCNRHLLISLLEIVIIVYVEQLRV